MIISTRVKLGCLNELTQYLDKYLVIDCDWTRTYIYEKPIGDTWLIRVPGATIGKFKTKNNKIESISLYEDDCFNKLKYYDRSVLNNLSQFVGRKIML